MASSAECPNTDWVENRLQDQPLHRVDRRIFDQKNVPTISQSAGKNLGDCEDPEKPYVQAVDTTASEQKPRMTEKL